MFPETRMPKADQINKIIEEKVASQLPPRLFQQLLFQHTKNGFRDCNCEYCSDKKYMTKSGYKNKEKLERFREKTRKIIALEI